MTELKLQNCRLDGRYDIQDCLGRGSYAEIYVARDRAATDGMPSMVVIKALNVFLQGVPDTDLERTLIENFQNEAVALDRVRHANIISRLGHGTAIDLTGTTFHYLVLEYMPGGDLATLCRTAPLTLKEMLFYLEQVCAGLAHAHRGGVIHRDIKPQNLLLSADREVVKIADFGVAKLEATEGIITRVGTNVYAAPEHNPLVQTGALDLGPYPQGQSLTPAADIFSLAKTTYTLLVGEPPRRFSHRQITELPEAIAEEEWAPSILRVLRRATAMRPEDRYQTVQDFWDELADAALPPTRPLRPAEDITEAAEQKRASSKLMTSSELAAKIAPPRPRFNSSQELKQQQLPVDARPRIVVRVKEAEPAPLAPAGPRPRAREIIDAFSDSPIKRKRAAETPPAAGRWTRFLVASLLILAFAGMLLATHNYIRGRWPLWRNSPQVTERDAGREGVVNTTANLRTAPNGSVIRVVEKGSRVRVLRSSDDDKWYEVEATATDGSSNGVTRGWMGKRVIDLNS